MLQIRAAITKLSHKATKNDIISELFNCSAPESGSGTLIPRGPPSIDLSIDERAFQVNYSMCFALTCVVLQVTVTTSVTSSLFSALCCFTEKHYFLQF